MQIFCCLNAVNNYGSTEICFASLRRYVFFDLGKDLEHRSIEFRRHAPYSDIKLRKYVESIYNQRSGYTAILYRLD